MNKVLITSKEYVTLNKFCLYQFKQLFIGFESYSCFPD